MATMNLTIPDAQINRVIHALAVSSGQPSPPETAAFAKSMVTTWIKAVVTQVERDEARNAYVKFVEPDIDVTGIVS